MDDYLTPEAGVVAAATAAVLSPRVRGALRRGAVYGLAGALKVGDSLASFSRGVERGVRGGIEQAKAAPVEPAEAAGGEA